ncbi:MAG: hypothetical protein ACFB4J_15660 [Elainellaceae cyanobacterium]
MNHIVFWILGFGTFWFGLTLFDDEAVLIAAAVIGSALILTGLISAPLGLQISIEVLLVVALFNVCIQCIKRGGA